MLAHLKKHFPSTFVIAGNVSTPDAVRDLESWGADAVKVGIGPGSACTTFHTTGFGYVESDAVGRGGEGRGGMGKGSGGCARALAVDVAVASVHCGCHSVSPLWVLAMCTLRYRAPG